MVAAYTIDSSQNQPNKSATRTRKTRDGRIFQFDGNNNSWRQISGPNDLILDSESSKSKSKVLDSSEAAAPLALPWRLYNRPVYVNGQEILINESEMRSSSEQETGDTGTKLWDASVVMAEFIAGVPSENIELNSDSNKLTKTVTSESDPESDGHLTPQAFEVSKFLFNNKRNVLELGAGCGLVGITNGLKNLYNNDESYRKGTKDSKSDSETASNGLDSDCAVPYTLITDLPYCIPNIRKNIDTNLNNFKTGNGTNTELVLTHKNHDQILEERQYTTDLSLESSDDETKSPQSDQSSYKKGPEIKFNATNIDTNSNIHTHILDWFNPRNCIEDLKTTLDLNELSGTIVGADILWVRELAAPLANTIKTLLFDMSNENLIESETGQNQNQMQKFRKSRFTHFVLAHQTRSKNIEESFFELVKPYLKLEQTITVNRNPDINIFVFAKRDKILTDFDSIENMIVE